MYFITDCNMAHPGTVGPEEINGFLTALALKNVAPNTQAQALNALVFLYKEVLGKDLSGQIDFTRTKRSPKIPVFLEKFEITAMLQYLKGATYLAACLMYGSGLRVMEVCRLRYHDVDLHRMCLYVRESKGQKMQVS